jgi:hypothetical protein
MTVLASRRLFYLHTLVAAETLSMVCPVESGLEWLQCVERFVVAVLAAWRFDANRTVVVTALADNIFVAVEIGRYLARFDVFQQLAEHLLVWKPHRLILFGNDADGHRIRDL